MMPDLGTYAGEVLLAYSVTLGLIAGLVFQSVRVSRKTKARLDAAEARKSDG